MCCCACGDTTLAVQRIEVLLCYRVRRNAFARTARASEPVQTGWLGADRWRGVLAEGRERCVFQNLHDLGRSFSFRFAQEQVNVLGHHDISDDDEPVTQACLFQNSEEAVALLCRAQFRPSPVTGIRDKVQIVRAAVAVEVAQHRSESRLEGVDSHPSKNEGWGTLCPGWGRKVQGWASPWTGKACKG